MPIVMGHDQHRAQITAEWIDLATGEISRGRVAPAERVAASRFLSRFAGRALEAALAATMARASCTSSSSPKSPSAGAESPCPRHSKFTTRLLAASRGQPAPTVRGSSTGPEQQQRRLAPTELVDAKPTASVIQPCGHQFSSGPGWRERPWAGLDDLSEGKPGRLLTGWCSATVLNRARGR
jgi:hypothetical protein